MASHGGRAEGRAKAEALGGDSGVERASACSPSRGESGIIVFGGGGGRGGAGRGCLFWIALSIVLSVALTVLANLVLLLFW